MNKIEKIARDLFGDAPAARCGGEHGICLNCAKCRADLPDQLWSSSMGVISVLDATNLKADASTTDINNLCELANAHHCAAVCVNSWFSHVLRLRLVHSVKNCTVINFPLGASSLEAVEAEVTSILEHGIEEVDMVQSLSAVKSGLPKLSYDMIHSVASICYKRDAVLKVIVETCVLSEEELIISCLYAKKAGADFVKTSTGFGSAGAKLEDVELMRRCVGPKMGVKASGGIRDRETALAMLEAGANRIGASNVLALL